MAILLMYLPLFSQRPGEVAAYFDGKQLVGLKNPGQWKIENGTITMLSAEKTGRLATVNQYNDVQIHIEWQPPFPPLPSNSGNSGVFFGPYELQILDSYRQTSKSPDAQAGSIYGQYPPYVNACLPPDKWTSFDILYHNARFDRKGKLLKPARMTVLQNGLFIHHDRVLTGEILRRKEKGKTIVYNEYVPHREIDVSLQEHGSIVSFRNIWLLEVEPEKGNNKISQIDLIRLELARDDPFRKPYNKINLDPPVVSPVGSNRLQPSDARIISPCKIMGNLRQGDSLIIATGMIRLAGNYNNSQLHFQWTGAESMVFRVLDYDIVFKGTPGSKNTADIALSMENIAGKTTLCVTSLVNGIFDQIRKLVDTNQITEIEIGTKDSGSTYTISELWVRDMDPLINEASK